MNRIKILKRKTLMVMSLIVIGCSVSKFKMSTKNFLSFKCDSLTIRELLLNGDTYPAIARENQVEALLNYNIIVQEGNIKALVLFEKYIVNNEIKNEEKYFQMNEAFSQKIAQKLQSICNKLIKGSYEISIAYKIQNSNFKPNPNSYDLLIVGDQVKRIIRSY